MPDTAVQPPTLGPPGERCATCGAPLAPDQRYCLTCGSRRADARLPFRDHLPVATSEVVTSVAPPPPLPSHRGPVEIVAGVGCLLLALGIGVLIGQAGDGGTTAQAPPPQVISVGSAAPAAATAAPDASAGAAATPDGAAKASGAAAKKRKAKADTAARKSTGNRGAATAKLKQLQNLSPDQYQKQSQKLPKQVGTGGKPAPVNPAEKAKPAGGGSGFQDIG